MADENVGLDLASQTGQEDIKNAIDGLRTEGLANQEGQEAISNAVGLVASQLATALHGIVLKTTNASIGTLTVTENGTYDANDDADYDAYEEVVVSVPNSYETTDEGKVVSNGSLVSQSSQNISANGTYDTTENDEVIVAVPNSYKTTDEGKVVSNGSLVSQTSQNIASNGTYDTTEKNEVVVSVPNSYETTDEGKVVSSGELVAQTSRNVTENGTYDTTLNNEVVVNVLGGGGGGEYSLSLAEYLQFYGTSPGQIIGLPYTVLSDYEIEVDFEVTETSSNNSVIGNSNKYDKPHLTIYNNKWYTSTGGNDLSFGNSSMLTGRHTVVINKNGNSVLFDEQVVLSNLSNNSYQDVYLWVGGRYSSSPGYTLAKAKIYEYKIVSISTGNVICDLKPAEIKKNNNVVIIGLYDVINDVFYTSSGTTVSGTLIQKTITQNGTYNPADDNADGYSQVVVNVEANVVGDVVINENEIKSVSEGSFSFSKSTTITKNGQYKITAFSYANNLNVTINGVTQSLDLEATSNYVRAYSKTIALNAGDIVTVSSSGTGRCLASVVVVDLNGNNSDDNNVLYNPTFNINTTGQTSWDASNSGTSSGSRTHTVDAWDIMQATAEDVSGGIKIVPKKSYAYLTQQIPYWFAGKSVKITAVVNDIEYTVTGMCPSSGTGVSLNTPFGQLYIYAYAYADIVFTLSFENQVDSIFVVKEANLQIAA